MATSDCPQGYQCEFIDSVPEDFYCKKCTLVARQLTFTSCCGESYCHACITDIQEQGKPCPACEREAFTTVELMKYQKRVNQLQVYCSMKERGCDWSGTLEQLDTHLDPDQDNCQYVDTKCPLNCHMTIPKNKVEQHVAQHCAKRPYACHEIEKKFQDQDRDRKEEKKMQEEAERQKELEQKKLSRISFSQKFKMKSFSKEKAEDLHSTWKSPAKYTHVSGYQFCIGVDANGRDLGRGKSIYVAVWGVPGEFDDQLKWPAKANFTIELINQQGGANATCTTLVNLERSMMKHIFLASFQRITIGGGHAFLEHSLLYNFLINDTLHFHVSEIHFLL